MLAEWTDAYVQGGLIRVYMGKWYICAWLLVHVCRGQCYMQEGLIHVYAGDCTCVQGD